MNNMKKINKIPERGESKVFLQGLMQIPEVFGSATQPV